MKREHKGKGHRNRKVSCKTQGTKVCVGGGGFGLRAGKRAGESKRAWKAGCARVPPAPTLSPLPPDAWLTALFHERALCTQEGAVDGSRGIVLPFWGTTPYLVSAVNWHSGAVLGHVCLGLGDCVVLSTSVVGWL